jgi:predicted nucleic acid-binding protein
MSGKGTGKLPTVYWDSSVWIAYLQDETTGRKPGELEGAKDMVAQADRGKLVIVTSVIGRIEVLATQLDAEGRDRFRKVFERRAFQEPGVDRRVADVAAGIRESALADGRKIKTPDAIHIATAIVYEIPKVHTLDDKLLAISGTPIVKSVIIEKPQADQNELFRADGQPRDSSLAAEAPE